MNFYEWLKKRYGTTWEELFCKVSDSELINYTIEYERYCQNKNIEPVWVD